MATPRLHIPVMVNETIELLKARTFKNSIWLDMTVGTGGHTEALLQHAPRSTVIGLDRDASTLELVRERLQPYGDRLLLVHGDFRDAQVHLENLGTGSVDGCLIDAGMSLWQVDSPDRGLSFRYDAPLDMRFGRTESTPTAADLVNSLSEEQLTQLFYNAGETGWARRIAARIITHRRHRRITSTAQLVEIIAASIPAKRHAPNRPHIATKIFASLRQAVNQEMDAIATGLLAAAAVTAVHGRIVVLTYSSTEDRTAKTTLRRLSAHHRETRNIFDEASVAQGPPFSLPSPRVLTPPVVPVLRIVTPKPLVPTAEEKRSNPRSRSAKLRAAEKVAATVNVQ